MGESREDDKACCMYYALYMAITAIKSILVLSQTLSADWLTEKKKPPVTSDVVSLGILMVLYWQIEEKRGKYL